jgi:hypothetical protein
VDESKQDGATDWRHNSPPDGYTEREIAFLTEQLQPICGEPLTCIRKAVGDVFEFGIQRPAKNLRGEDITRADFFLKFIYADWRVMHRGRIILASVEHSDDEHLIGPELVPEPAYVAASQVLAREFFVAVTEGKFIVQSVIVREHADLTIQLSDELKIESFSSSCQNKDVWYFCNDNAKVSGIIGTVTYNIGTFNERI